jgi:aldos-2-ulose dehydratase
MQSFLPQIIDPTRTDGYWVEAFPFETDETRCPDVVGYGLGTQETASKICLYLNPYRDSSNLKLVQRIDPSSTVCN